MARLISLDDYGSGNTLSPVPLQATGMAPPAPAPVQQAPAPAPVPKPAPAPVPAPVQTAVPTATAPPAAASQPLPQMPPPPAGQVTGGNQPPLTGTPPPVGGIPNFTLPALDGSSYVAATTGQGQPQTNPADLVNAQLQQLLQGNYAQNARLRGAEVAAQRGLRNSSIAAGASERAAMEAVQPLVDQAQALTRQREQLSFQGEQNQLDRIQGVNDRLLQAEVALRQSMADFKFQQTLQGDKALQEDWLANNQYLREFNATLSTLPLKTAADLATMVAQYALENPEIYPPNTISGLQNFLSGSVIAMFQNYFPNYFRNGTGGT